MRTKREQIILSVIAGVACTLVAYVLVSVSLTYSEIGKLEAEGDKLLRDMRILGCAGDQLNRAFQLHHPLTFDQAQTMCEISEAQKELEQTFWYKLTH